MLRKSQPDFQRYIKKIEAQAKNGKKKFLKIKKTCNQEKKKYMKLLSRLKPVQNQ